MAHNIPSNLRVFLQELDKHLSSKTDLLVGGADITTLRKRYSLARQFYDYDEREKLDRNFQLVEVEFLGEQPTRFD
ncbi:MAG: hypothetical protein ACRD1X_16655 [Vicinamibacteria bacterium]